MGHAAAVHPADEVPKHLLGYLEVGDHAVAQRTGRADVGRRPPDHPPSVRADSVDPVGALVDRDHGRLEEDLTAEVKGRDLLSGLPKTVTLTSDGVRQALEEPLRVIINTIKDTLERTPPELAADIAERGIMLAGGGSLLKGFEALVAAETKMTTSLADSPLTCVVIGSGRSLEEFEVMGRAGRDSGHRRLRRR